MATDKLMSWKDWSAKYATRETDEDGKVERLDYEFFTTPRR